MLSSCGTWSSRQIGTRCRNIHARILYKPVCNRMAWHTDCNRIEPSRRSVRHNILFLKNHRERSRPECIRKLVRTVRYLTCEFVKCPYIRYMHDERIVARSSLGTVYPARRVLLQCISSEPVHRLRGKCHKPAAL